ncbi:MAG TPA: hypothetical protein VMF30_06910 [Pirellulales bacterium]|nr:hypothetical protein [Pirellulales bacterium]
MNVLRGAVRLVGQHFRALVLLNVVYFGLVGSGMAYGAWDREAQSSVRWQAGDEAAKVLPGVVDAYQGGRVLRAIGWTFGVNLIVGSLLVITLPSLLLPFSGVATAALRAVMWGIVFAPKLGPFNVAGLVWGLLVGAVMLLEGEAYVLAMLGSYLHGKAVLSPSSVGAITRWQGYKQGVGRLMRLYPLIAAVLAVAAVWESVTVIYALPRLR